MIISVLFVHWTVWGIHVQTWTWFHWTAILASIAVFALFTVCVSVINITSSSSRDGASFGMQNSFARWEFWLGTVVACSICVVPYRKGANFINLWIFSDFSFESDFDDSNFGF